MAWHGLRIALLNSSTISSQYEHQNDSHAVYRFSYYQLSQMGICMYCQRI